MPVLVLLLSFIGNYYTYHSKGDLVQVKEEFYSPTVEYYEGTTLQNSGFIENIYFNTNLTNDEIVSIFVENESLFSNYSHTSGGVDYFPFGNEGSFLPIACYGGTPTNPTNILVMATLGFGSDTAYALTDIITDDLYWSYINDSSFGIPLGWNSDILSSNGVLSVNSNLSYYYNFNFVDNSYIPVDIGIFNHLFSDFISSTPIEHFSSGGDLIREEIKYLTFEEYIGDEYIIPSELINGQFIDSISINNNFNESQMLDIFEIALNYMEDNSLILFTYDNYTLGIMDFFGGGVKEGCVFGAYIGDSIYCFYCPSFLYNELLNIPDVLTSFHVSNPGWNNLDLFPLVINSSDYYFNSFLSDFPLLTTTEIVVSTKEKVDLSFFDITLMQTDNTFNNFQLPFLRNVFDNVFNILEFETSYLSSFILTSFTWFIQLMLLHVVVDTLAFIFKIYHKLMDKVV